MSFDTAAGTATAKLAERLLADSESKIFLRTIQMFQANFHSFPKNAIIFGE